MVIFATPITSYIIQGVEFCSKCMYLLCISMNENLPMLLYFLIIPLYLCDLYVPSFHMLLIVQVGMSNVGFLMGCYPGLALATAMPGGKRIG